MARWEPDSEGRLREAAYALYAERGFEATTVAEIAARAGLTERTFFRYFADKREVLFAGSEQLERLMLDALAAVPEGASPFDAAVAAVGAAGTYFPNREHSRGRAAIIEANQELQERERTKLASLASAFGDGLRARGVEEPTASLTAEVAIAVFHVAFQRWLVDEERSFVELVHDSVGELRALT